MAFRFARNPVRLWLSHQKLGCHEHKNEGTHRTLPTANLHLMAEVPIGRIHARSGFPSPQKRSIVSAYDGSPAGRTFRVIEKDYEQPAHQSVAVLVVPAIPAGFQTHYATVLVTVYQEAGSWVITVSDPFGAGTSAKVTGSIGTAKQHALIVAQWYLRNTYPDLSWPAIPDELNRWKKIPRWTN